jgi:hypothetical protein
MLNYHNIGTIYMKGYIPSASKRMSSGSVQAFPHPATAPGTIPHVYSSSLTTISQSTQPNTTTTNIEVNSRTYNASASGTPFISSQKNGFTQELNKRNGAGLSSENLTEDEFLIVRQHKAQIWTFQASRLLFFGIQSRDA